MRRTHVAAAIAAALLAGITHAQAVDTQNTQNTWKLEDMYASQDAWNADAKKVEDKLTEATRDAREIVRDAAMVALKRFKNE